MASAGLIPIALTFMRTSLGPGAGTSTSTNSRTSGPPGFANLIVRDMAVSFKPTLPGFWIVARQDRAFGHLRQPRIALRVGQEVRRGALSHLVRHLSCGQLLDVDAAAALVPAGLVPT